MAYTTISQLQELLSDNAQNSDYLLISSGDASYKLRIDELKNFMNLQFVLEDWMFESKTITSITNTIHATAMHYKVEAGEELHPGDLVTIYPEEHVEGETDHLPKVMKADNTTSPAVGIVKYYYSDYFEGVYDDTYTIAAGDTCVIITAGIFSPIDTSAWAAGSVLWTGTDGEFTDVKPDSGNVQQMTAIVLHSSDGGDGAIMCLFGPPEQQADAISYDPSDSTGLTSITVKTAIDELFQRCDRELVTLEKVLIDGNEIQLTQAVHGEGVYKTAMIFDDQTTNVCEDFTFEIGPLDNKIVFDSNDDIDGKYATLTYMGIKVK